MNEKVEKLHEAAHEASRITGNSVVLKMDQTGTPIFCIGWVSDGTVDEVYDMLQKKFGSSFELCADTNGPDISTVYRVIK